MLTSEQIQQEKRREQEYNRISDKIIGIMPFGKFYGLMKAASNMGDSMLKKNICIDPDGRIVPSYKTNTGKIMGAWFKPQHEIITENLSKKKWKKALFGSIPIVGQISRARDQKRLQKKGLCFDMTIEEFMAEQKKREELGRNLNTNNSTTNSNNSISLQSNPNDIKNKNSKFLGMPRKVGIGVTIGIGVLLITGVFVALARRK